MEWKGFVGDEIYGYNKPIFKVTASSLKCSKKNPIKVFPISSPNNKKCCEYKIVGRFTKRDCVIYDAPHVVVEVVIPFSFIYVLN